LEGLSKRSGIEASFDLQPPSFPRLVPELETAIFRIVQEAVTNVFRHAAADHVWVSMSGQGSRVIVTIRDNGKGISDEIAKFRQDSIGIGISGMRQRVKECGGELRLQNANPGTLVEVNFPAQLQPDAREYQLAPQ
jgi:signal transduction histidine kinase